MVLQIALPPHSVEDSFGVGAFVSQRSDSVAPLTIRRVRLLGVGWVREEFTASEIHPGPHAPYSWRSYDRVIDAERRAGLQVLGLLDYSNTWSYGNHANMPHRHLARLSADFSRFAYAAVKHFRGRIRYWQIWNEPDLAMFWRPKPNPDDYAVLLRSAYRSIKRANPLARVVLAGLSGMDLPFLRRVARRTDSFDIVAVHPYRGSPETELIEEVHALRSLHRPIWFSEIGWAAGRGCGSCSPEDEQARNLVRFYALALALGVQRIFWYDLRDDMDRPRSPEAHFGLLRRDLSGKPAFAAYEALARVLHGADFTAASALDDGGVYALRFKSTQGQVGIAWNTDDTPHRVHLPWLSPIALTLNLYGQAQDIVTVSHGQANWTIPPDGKPYYLVSNPVGLQTAPPGALLHPTPPPPRPRARKRHSPSTKHHASRPVRRAPHPSAPRQSHGSVRNRAAGTVSNARGRRPSPTPQPPRRREHSFPVRPSATPSPQVVAAPSPTPTRTPSAPTPSPTAQPSPSPTAEPSATPEATASPVAP